MRSTKMDVFVKKSARAPGITAAVATAIAGTVLVSGPIVSRAAQPQADTPKPEPAKVQAPLTSPEFVEAGPLLSKAVSLLETASKAVEQGQPGEARAALSKAGRLVSAAQRLLEDVEAERAGDPVALPQPQGRPGRRAPPFDPGSEEDFWADDGWFGNPGETLRRFQERMEGLMRQWPGPALRMEGFKPSMDVEDDGKNYTVKLDLPGVDKNKINVRVEGRVLTVSGESDSVVEQKDNKDRVLRKERHRGQFSRMVTLPGPVNGEKLEARYENGVLRVILPKAGEPKELKSVPVL